MLVFDEAFNLTLSNANTLPSEKIVFTESLGRILAEDIISDIDMPPFDKSAMDGYACKRSDIDKPLKIIETIAAGEMPRKNIENGTCAKIMTGAPIPTGADCVIVVEKTDTIDSETIKYLDTETPTNICLKGEDIKKGDIVLKKGTQIKPQEIAVLATTGYHTVQVHKKPKVGVVATGDELCEPGKELPEGSIRNSNSHQLTAQINSIGLNGINYGIAKDTPDDIQQAIQTLEKETDVILLSGGVSMGDFDFVPGELEKAGYQFIYHKILVKPGMPLLFGVKGDKFCFGLPGNPVSTFTQFEYLIKPFLLKLMGCSTMPLQLKMPLKNTFKRKKTTRDSIVPVKIINGEIEPLEYHGSAHINALPQACGLMKISRGTAILEKGEFVDVRLV